MLPIFYLIIMGMTRRDSNPNARNDLDSMSIDSTLSLSPSYMNTMYVWQYATQLARHHLGVCNDRERRDRSQQEWRQNEMKRPQNAIIKSYSLIFPSLSWWIEPVSEIKNRPWAFPSSIWYTVLLLLPCSESTPRILKNDKLVFTF